MTVSSIDQVRSEIASLEERLEKLRQVESILAELSGEGISQPSPRKSRVSARQQMERRPEKFTQPVGRRRGAKLQGREGSTPNAILALLETQGPLARAEIEEAIRAEREIGKQTVSVSLQRLRGSGKIQLEDGKWGLAA